MKICPTRLLCAVLILFFVSCEYNDDYYYGGSYDDTYNENYMDYGENPFVNAKDEPVSTFAVDADGGSYANMRRFINFGQNP